MTSRPEVEWDDTEREWMLALERYRVEVLCPCGCGYPAEVSQDPATEFRVKARPPVRCHIRTALERAQKAHREQSPDSPMSGLLWGADIRES